MSWVVEYVQHSANFKSFLFNTYIKTTFIYKENMPNFVSNYKVDIENIQEYNK